MPEIAESRTFVEAAKPSKHEGVGRLRVALLTPGWGSSGYYSADVCESAGTNRVFKAGTHMYINHPTATENYERPVRDLTQLAAVLAEDATWNSDEQELQAEVTTFSNWRAPIAEMAPHIGVSIRASADIQEEGEAEGRTGPIITNIVEAASVDFVTKAGRGGKILEVVEDAFGKGRANAQHTVQEALSGDVRERLQDIIKETYRKSGPDVYQYAWVRDFDADSNVVYFDVEGGDLNGTFQQSFEVGADEIPTDLTGDPIEVRVATSYVPVAAPSGQSTTTEASQEDPTMPQIEEARLRVLEAAEARAADLETELAASNATAQEAQAALARERAQTSATTIVESVFADLKVEGGVATKALLLKNVSLREDGSLDEDALRKNAGEAAAELAEAAGQGKVHGVGGSSANDEDDDISEEAYLAELAKIREG